MRHIAAIRLTIRAAIPLVGEDDKNVLGRMTQIVAQLDGLWASLKALGADGDFETKLGHIRQPDAQAELPLPRPEDDPDFAEVEDVDPTRSPAWALDGPGGRSDAQIHDRVWNEPGDPAAVEPTVERDDARRL